MSKIWKISLAETLSRVTNSSILENPQFGRVSVVVAMVIVITSVIGEFICLMQLSDCRCPITANCPITLSDYNPTEQGLYASVQND